MPCLHTLLANAAGDSLFRVAARQPMTADTTAGGGCQRVQVTTRAAIRVLAWKIWTVSDVVYDIIQQPSGADDGSAQVNFELVSSVSGAGQPPS